MIQQGNSEAENTVFDVIVVGGGVYGTVLARECAAKGLKTILLEKEEICQDTSANSLNILHGGLRYLQHLDIRRMRRSIYSRRYFQQIAPDYIETLPFLLPLDNRGPNRSFIVWPALLLNDLISFDRNKGLEASSRIPRSVVLKRQAVLETLPILKKLDFGSAAFWHEAVMGDPVGMVGKIAAAAAEHGATISPRTEARGLRLHHDKVSGVHCRRHSDDSDMTYSANIVIDTTGRSSKRLGDSIPGYQGGRASWARAVNMLVSRTFFENYSIGFSYRDNLADKKASYRQGQRQLFFVPRKYGTAIGTFYEHEKDIGGDLSISNEHQEMYLDAVNSVLPEGHVSAEDIIGWNSGWLPLDNSTKESQLNLAKSSQVRPIESNGVFSGLIEVRSVKFTTAPAVARDVLKLLDSL